MSLSAVLSIASVKIWNFQCELIQNEGSYIVRFQVEIVVANVNIVLSNTHHIIHY